VSTTGGHFLVSPKESYDELEAEKAHRAHAIVEQVIADLKNGPLAHLPSGSFAANSAWVVCAAVAFNLTRSAGVLASAFHAKAATGTIRAQSDQHPRQARPFRPPARAAPASRLAVGDGLEPAGRGHPARTTRRRLTLSIPSIQGPTGTPRGDHRPARPHKHALNPATTPPSPLEPQRSPNGGSGLALGLLLGAAAAFSPFLQWWNLAGSFLPEALAVLASALFIRILHAPSRWWLVTHAVALVWVLVTFALVLYPPFQIPCALVAAAFCLGYLVSATTDVGWRALRGRLGIVSACAAMSVACVLLFLVDHRSAVAAIAASAYPGKRTVGSGGYSLTRLFSGFLDRTLTSRAAAKSIDSNQSEASSPLLAGVLAAPVAVWLIVADLRRRRRCSSVLVALLAVLAVFMVRLFAPHMDVLSQLTMLDRVPSNRLLLGMGMLSDVVLVTVAWQVSTSRPLRPPLLTTAFVLPFLALSALAVYLHRQHDVFVGPLAVAVALAAVVASAVALWATRRPELGAALLIVVSLFIAGMVNPLSAGVSTTGELPLGTAVAQLDRSDPGGWIMPQNRLGMAALVEQNVHTYSVVYNYPQTALWRELDPTGAQSDSYNRYGFANFQLRRGRTQFPGYNLDSYRIAIDGCSTFVQRHVKHIVAERPVDTGCLRLHRTVSEGTAVFYLYDVISPNADLPAARSFGLVPHRSSRCTRAANPPRPMLLGPVGMAPSAGAAPQCSAGRVRPGT